MQKNSILKLKKVSTLFHQVITVRDLIYFLDGCLKRLKVLDSRLEADQMVSFLLKCEREGIYLQFDKKIDDKVKKLAFHLLQRRFLGEPLSYLLERKFFYKHNFYVNSDVLIPRVETEEVVDATLQWIHSFVSKRKNFNQKIQILDLGTGSGCIGLSLLKEVKDSYLVGVDISSKALEVAKRNARALGLEKRCFWIHGRVEELNSKLFPSFLKHSFDCVVSNPPYIDIQLKNPISRQKLKGLEESVFRFEPHEALFAPKRGMEYLLSWSLVAFNFLSVQSFFALEVGDEFQMAYLKKALRRKAFSGDSLSHSMFVRKDFFGKKRVLCMEKKI